MPEISGPTVYYTSTLGYALIRGKNTAAGWDVTNAFDAPLILSPGDIVVLPTGILLAMPHTLHAELKTRSSMAVKGILIGGGIIDWDYRGEIQVIVSNISNQPVTIDPGVRVAQLLFYGLAADIVELKRIDEVAFELHKHTVRGSSGFGSTGQ